MLLYNKMAYKEWMKSTSVRPYNLRATIVPAIFAILVISILALSALESGPNQFIHKNLGPYGKYGEYTGKDVQLFNNSFGVSMLQQIMGSASKYEDYQDVEIIMVSDDHNIQYKSLFYLQNRAVIIPDRNSKFASKGSWGYNQLADVMADYWEHNACLKGTKYIAAIDDDSLCTADEFNSMMWAVDYHDAYISGKVHANNHVEGYAVPGYLKVFNRKVMCGVRDCLSRMTGGFEDKQTSKCLEHLGGGKWLAAAGTMQHKRRLMGPSYVCIRCDMAHDTKSLNAYASSYPKENAAKNIAGGSWTKGDSGNTIDKQKHATSLVICPADNCTVGQY